MNWSLWVSVCAVCGRLPPPHHLRDCGLSAHASRHRLKSSSGVFREINGFLMAQLENCESIVSRLLCISACDRNLGCRDCVICAYLLQLYWQDCMHFLKRKLFFFNLSKFHCKMSSHASPKSLLCCDHGNHDVVTFTSKNHC